MIAVFGGFLIFFLLFALLFPATFHERFGSTSPFWLVTFFAVIVLSELAARTIIQGSIARGETVPPLIRYAIALVEISIPTITILLLAQSLDPFEALFGPSSYVYMLIIIIGILGLDFKLSVFTGLVAAVQYYTLGQFFIGQADSLALSAYEQISIIPKSLFYFLAGAITGVVALEIKRRIRHSFQTVQERNTIISLFGQHVSPAVVGRLLDEKQIFQSERQNVCVMFLDIRNFTPFSEQNAPEAVVDYLNTLLDYMIVIVDSHHGIINKFLGDGFMAVFGAPLANANPSLDAVQAALEIIATTEAHVTAGRIAPTRLGIGLHTGDAITGTIGSSLRKEYTIIGDTVNLAARVEQLNKQLNSQLLLTEETWDALANDQLPATSHGPLHVKGREQPVTIYQLA